METHRQQIASSQTSASTRKPSFLIDVAERVALAVEWLRNPVLRAERYRVRTVADTLVGVSGA
jgi:hypothetical protein